MEKTRLDKLLTCSDSSSGSARLMSLYSNRSQHVRYEVLQSVTRTVGVTGNQRADELPKTALVKANIEMQTSEVKWVIWEKNNLMWQERWDRERRGRHLSSPSEC